ncbi:MAG: hypothetical protein LW626_07735 [Verrucomicrobium sp.]|nr:hypothetical protein [Verrucomicrobium sp.]
MTPSFGLQTPDPTGLHRHINLKLAELGMDGVPLPGQDRTLDPLVETLIAQVREKDRLLARYASPVDRRINNFLHDYLSDIAVPRELPRNSFVLDQYGLARVLSLPPDRDEVASPMLRSYRLRNGILHNPKADRRTTAGIFHVTEGGLPIPDDKKGVPKAVFADLLARALQPPEDLLRLPFTASGTRPAACLVSLLIRPVVCPEVPGVTPQKSMEVRFFVPGSLVANLDFVESIFGNAGDPMLPENDAALDAEHWSGHTGCVILAPHLNGLTKKEVGLPHRDEATERQRRDGMCWTDPRELYNDGNAFKLTARDASGVIVTLISDNYFGYCKKEVKTQISYAANLLGLVEEEHAGGALVFARHDLGSEYDAQQHRADFPYSFSEVARLMPGAIELQPEGHAVDRRFPSVVYVPETARFDIESLTVRWDDAGQARSIRLRRDHHYLLPSGFRVTLEPPAMAGRAWRLVGTRPEGTLCHKPCTVSGGGKSEISKPITDAILFGSVFVADLNRDFDRVAEILARDFSGRFRDPARNGQDRRPILSPSRTLGSVIKPTMPGSPRCPRTSGSWCWWSSGSGSPPGATSGGPASAWTSSTARPPTSSGSAASGWSPSSCGWATTRTAPGAPSDCARTSCRPSSCRWRMTSPPASPCRAPSSRDSIPRASIRRSSSSKTPNSGCSRGPTTPSTGATTRPPRRTSPRAGISSATTSPCLASRPGRSWTTPSPSSSTRRPCAG